MIFAVQFLINEKTRSLLKNKLDRFHKTTFLKRISVVFATLLQGNIFETIRRLTSLRLYLKGPT